MKKILKIKLFFVVFLVFSFAVLFGLTSRTSAALNASSSFQVNVEISPQGFTWVEYKIKLRNETEGFSINEYSILSDHTDLTDITFRENGKSAYFRKEHSQNQVRMRVVLQKQLLHKGDSTDIYLKYRTSQLNNTKGLVRSLYIPSVRTEEKLESAKYSVKIPREFGEPSYISLTDKEITEDKSFQTIKYSKDDAPFGTLVLFGEKQQFEFTYSYKLENYSEQDKKYTVLLPPNSDFQDVYMIKSSPTPQKVFVDKDGNVLAEYLVEEGDTYDVLLSGVAIYSIQSEKTNLQNFDTYLTETKVWNFSEDIVREKVEKITRDDYSTYENAKLVYEFIENEYSHKPSEKSERYSASQILKGTEGLECQNVNDLYITLLRGAAVPTREVVGYSSNFQDVDRLHHWTEVYDNKTQRWFSADPCLGAIYGIYGFDEVDVNRMVLAYRSSDHASPEVILPFKKLQNEEFFNLEIKLSSYDYVKTDQQVSVDFEVGELQSFQTSVPISIIVTNNSQSVVGLKEVSVDGKSLEVSSDSMLGSFQQGVYPAETEKLNFWFRGLDNIAFEKIRNFDLKVESQFNKQKQIDEFQFEINQPIDIAQVGVWIASFVGSVFSIGIFSVAVKKMKNFRRKRKIKRKFRDSNMKDMMDVPVSMS